MQRATVADQMVIKVLTPMAVSKEYIDVTATNKEEISEEKKNIKEFQNLLQNASTLEALKQVEQHLRRTIIKLLHTRIKKRELTPKTKA
jgi:predicted RNA-binding Zn ribbon-like protein